MNKEEKNKKILRFISIFGSIFVFVGAFIIYLYANGWRIDIFEQKVIKTGVLTVESDPSLANIFVDNQSKGRTPKSSSLDIGSHKISVKKDGYIEWNKEVEIQEEKSTNIYPWLVKNSIKKENVSSIDNRTYINSWSDENRSHILILTSRNVDDKGTIEYELWLYIVNTTFWDLSENPKVILSFQTAQSPTIQLTPSPSGIYWILNYTEDATTTTYLLDTSVISTLSNLPILNVSQFSLYTMTWSKNNQYLMFESDQDLISFNIQRQSRYLLLKKSPGTKYIWITDEQGYFYILETNTEVLNENIYSYVLTQEEMDGSNPKTLVNDLFFQKDRGYIEQYRGNNSPTMYYPFTNSTASTKSVGDIQDIKVNQSAQGIYIKTETSSYWYNMRAKKYYLVSPYPSDLILFSPDNTKFIFKDTKGYSIFTFLNLNNDPTVEIGSKVILNTDIDKTEIIGWLSNSQCIYYLDNNSIYISDKDGENKAEILNDINSHLNYGIALSREYLFTISLIDNTINGTKSISIDRYLIH